MTRRVGTAQIAFWVFAAAMGASLSSIFLVYTGQSITQVFFVTAAALVGVVVQSLPEKGPPPPTAGQKAQNATNYGEHNAKVYAESKTRLAKAEARWQRQVAALGSLRQSMKNPESFVLSTALEMDDGTLCVMYRATNSFNAIVPGQAVITATAIHTSDDTWNSRCGGKRGTDKTGMLAIHLQ